MADLTIPIVGLTTLLGYIFGKKKYEEEDTERREEVSPNFVPNSHNIYTSDTVNEGNEQTQRRGNELAEAAKDPVRTNIIPPFYNTLGAMNVVGNTGIEYQSMSAMQFGEVMRENKTKNVVDAGSAKVKVEESPMFQPILRHLEEREEVAQFSSEEKEGEISLLTGERMERNHNNMVPFFGSVVRQNTEAFTNVNVLDNYTGNTSLYEKKKEVGSFYDKTPQNIYGSQVNINTERYIPSLFKQNEKPFDDEQIGAQVAGTIDNNIRPMFKTVDQLRVTSKPKETYKGRMNIGQWVVKGGLKSKMEKNRPETFYEKTEDHLFRTTGRDKAEKVHPKVDMKYTNRQDTTDEYFGNSSNVQMGVPQRVQRDGIDNSHKLMELISKASDPKREQFLADSMRNMRGPSGSNDYGKSGMTNYETERSDTEGRTHVLNVNKGGIGHTRQFVDGARTTTKETTMAQNKVGIVSGEKQGRSESYNGGISKFYMPVTQKEITTGEGEKYKGGAHKKVGLGYVTANYTADTTTKETTLYSHSGNAGQSLLNEQMNRESYANAEIRDKHEKLLSRDRASGPQMFNTGSGKDAMRATARSTTTFKGMKDEREKMNKQFLNVTPNASMLGGREYNTKNIIFAETENNRILPEINKQLSENPYALRKLG